MSNTIASIPFVKPIRDDAATAVDDMRVTGPAPLDADDPDRKNTRPLSFLRGIDPQDTSHKPFNRRFSEAISIMSLSKRGRRLLKALEDHDIHLGGLGPGQSYGFYLAYDRALFAQTRDLAETLRVISHEGRHAEQTIAGFSTVTEYHEPGTALPYDTRSYLRLNRVLEADADATALAVLWEVSQADDQYDSYWTDLYQDPHFGPMAKRFMTAALDSGYDPLDDRSVRAGMQAAFQTWPTVGQPLRSEGYDDHLMAWLESQAIKWDKPVPAHDTFEVTDVAKITAIGEAQAYWTPKGDPATAHALDQFEDRFRERFAAMGQQLLPAGKARSLAIDADAVQAWQANRRGQAASPAIPRL
ncbi:MAG: DUF6782 family putative metallopeptidase [Pseudomonadota bacterium]